MAQGLAAAKSQRVVDVMTRNVITANENTPLGEIADLMARHKVKRIPILRDRSVVGMVSRADLLQGLISLGSGLRTQRQTTAQSADERLRQSVLADVHGQSWSSSRRCDVVVIGGVVHLWGMAPNDAVRSAYIEAAKRIPGVKGIESHMHVPHRAVAG